MTRESMEDRGGGALKRNSFSRHDLQVFTCGSLHILERGALDPIPYSLPCGMCMEEPRDRVNIKTYSCVNTLRRTRRRDRVRPSRARRVFGTTTPSNSSRRPYASHLGRRAWPAWVRVRTGLAGGIGEPGARRRFWNAQCGRSTPAGFACRFACAGRLAMQQEIAPNSGPL